MMQTAQFGARYAQLARPRLRKRWPPGMVLRTVPRFIAGVPVGNPYALGALSPEEAVDEALIGACGLIQRTRAGFLADVRAGQLLDAAGQPAYVPGTGACAGARGSVKAPVMTVIGNTALRVAAATGPAAPFVFAAGMILDAGGFITGIFTHHHQQAVARERGTLCVEVPAANNALQAIDAAVQAGQLTPQQAIEALHSLQDNFDAAVAPIRQGCNAAAEMSRQLKAIVTYKISQYQDLAAAPGGGAVTAAVSQATAQTGLPSWVLYAAGAYLLWQLL